MTKQEKLTIDAILDKFASMHTELSEMLYKYVRKYKRIPMTGKYKLLYYDENKDVVMVKYETDEKIYDDELWIFSMNDYYDIIMSIYNEQRD